MINLFNKTKKSLCAITLAFFMALTSGLGLILSNLNFKQLFAAAAPVEISLTNSNFFDNKVTDEIVNPSGWTSLNKSENVASGIISINQDIFQNQMEDNYLLNFKPYSYEGIADEQILMINSKSQKSNSGFESESFSLEKSSYYKISFKALTENSNKNGEQRYAFGSANLIGDGFNDLSESIISINTSGNWIDYNFFVETNTISNVETKLQLWLGYSNGVESYGSVFFDNIRILKIDEETYRKSTGTYNAKYTNVCNLNTQLILNAIDNSNFENFVDKENTNKTGWNILTANNSNANNINNYAGLIYVNESFSSTDSKLDENPTNANIYGNTKALLINNKLASSIGFESNSFDIKQHQVYKITLFVKSNITTGTAQIKLVEDNPYPSNEDFDVKIFTLDVNTTSLTNEKNNNWIEYSIYIKGRSYENTTAKLQLWLGTESETATGYALFDNIVMTQITSNDYQTGSNESNILQANFAETSKQVTITNGNFNSTLQNDITKTYPYDVDGWSHYAQTKNATLNGIINTKDTSMIAGISNPTSGNPYSNNNNVLMIGNVGSNGQKYTSTSITLTANTVYKLSFMVQTQSLTNGATAGFKLYSDTLTLKELMYIESDRDWTTYTIYIKTGLSDISANVELSLGLKNNGSGYAFFDNVLLTQSTAEIFESANGTNVYKTNLYTETFTNTSDKSVDGIYTSNSFTPSTESANVKHGVIDVSDASVFEQYLPGIVNPNLPQNTNGNVLMISASDDSYFYYTSNQSYALTSGNYYKISIYAKTSNLSQKDENKVEISSGSNEYHPFGATISLTGIDKTFSGIVNTTWTEYIFYINATEDATIQVRLSIGQENAKTSGNVFFSTLNVETIAETAYYDAVEPLESEEHDNIMAVGSTEAPAPQEEETTSDNGINFDWLILPTLITALALIVAVVGVMIRKFAKTHHLPVKIGKGVYDREKTLEKEYEHREAIRKQQEKLAKLKEQLEEVKFEIADSKAEFRKEEKQFKQEVAEKVKEEKSKLGNSANRRKEIKEFKLAQRKAFNEEKRAKYELKQKQLREKFALIEEEIRLIYEEELKLIKAYKEYRRQVALKKKQLKQEKRQSKNK